MGFAPTGPKTPASSPPPAIWFQPCWPSATASPPPTAHRQMQQTLDRLQRERDEAITFLREAAHDLQVWSSDDISASPSMENDK